VTIGTCVVDYYGYFALLAIGSITGSTLVPSQEVKPFAISTFSILATEEGKNVVLGAYVRLRLNGGFQGSLHFMQFLL
jgi:hypothetical protein